MGGMEFNKVFAAILLAGIVAMFSGFIANQLTLTHDLEKDAYPIEADDAVAGGGAKEKLAEPILAMISEADIARGQKVSKACAACHSFDKGGPNGIGPNMWNIVGRKKQDVSGFAYSGVLNANGEEIWTYAALNKFLWKPKKYAPGTKMNYIGLKKPSDRAAMVAWLRTLSDAPKGLPGALEIAAEEAELVLPQVQEEEVKEAIETIREGTSLEDKSVTKAKSDFEGMKSTIAEKEALLEEKKQKVIDANKTIKGTVQGAKE